MRRHQHYIFHVTCKKGRQRPDLTLRQRKHLQSSISTSLSWAMSWVFTWPDTRFTRPNTCPVSGPQMVHVVSMLEVPANHQCGSAAAGVEVPCQPLSLCPFICWAADRQHFLSTGRVPGERKHHGLNPHPRASASAWRDETCTCGKLDSTGGINNHIPYLASFPFTPVRRLHVPQGPVWQLRTRISASSHRDTPHPGSLPKR